MLRISSAFQGGSVEVLAADEPGAIRIGLAPDRHTDHRHWFFFRLTGVRDRDVRITFANTEKSFRLASHAEVPDAWTGYRPFASYDTETWFRAPVEKEGAGFTIAIRPERDAIYFAQFPPYGIPRHLALVGRALADRDARLEVLGTTPEGFDLDLLTIGQPGPGKRVCWIIAQQHPSEPMGGWFMEGLIDRLLDPMDALARRLRKEAVFHLVPTMNPDGIALGQSRGNALGADLNRAWHVRNELAPEVNMVRDRIAQAGVDFFLDIHGDEQLPYTFLGGPLEIPSVTPHLRKLFFRFAKAWGAANPDYGLGPPYPGGAPKPADLRMAWNGVAEEHACLSVLLEQPFKDNDASKIEGVGWMPERSVALGRSVLDPLAAVLADLREARA